VRRFVMYRTMAIVFALAVSPSLLLADDKEEAAKNELKKFQGDWKAVKSEDDGRAATRGDPIIVEGDKLSLVIRDRITFVGKIKLNPTADPKTIDWEYTEGPGGVVGKVQRGIYRWDGDKLEVCWNPVGTEERPKKFTTKPSAGKGFQYRLYEKKKE
jgi:uncharacterized protein (TIGR03067 family)